ncbi:MAG: transketolase C-terminal domain-containing protein [Chromatiales bacterium]
MTALPVGKAEIKRSGKRIALLAFGTMVAPALEAGEDLKATVVNMRFVKPLDGELLSQLAETHELLLRSKKMWSPGAPAPGWPRCSQNHGRHPPIVHYGLPDRLIQHGTREEMLADAGLTTEGLLAFVRQHANGLVKVSAPKAVSA